MALLSVTKRKAIFQYLGLGEYNKANIKAFQKKYMLRKKDWDGVYGQDTQNTLLTVYFTKKYTKNFKPEEFRCECGGKYCCGYPNYMKPAQLIHIQSIRDKYGKPITITSGLRCKTWNNKLGGSIQNSLHMSGQALDFYQEGVTDTSANRKKSIKFIAKLPNHHYSYGNGIYRLTTDKTSSGSVSAPYMGNALHTDTYNNVKPTYPKYKETPKVIDISNFQDTIDFAKVKADGIKGVIVKCGYRGAETGKLAEDSRFLEHIQGAYKAGLPVGIYMFTQAKTATEGKEEAQFAIKMWKKAGVPISLPIAVDTENVFYKDDEGKSVAGRANGLSKAKRTTAIKAFCEEIKAQGYEPMIYASTSWLNSKLDMSQLPYKVWCAQYASKCEYKGDYILWQYSSEGNVDGVKGNVDMNYLYTDLVEVPCPKPPKTVDELAQEVIDGKWGNGDERKEKLEAEGYDYDAVQKKVNELLTPKAPSWLAKANKWCRKIAKDDSFIYVRFTKGKPNTQKCCICHPEIQKTASTKGFNCITAAFAALKHGAGLDINDENPIDNAGWNKLLSFKTDKEANEYASKRIGQPVEVIRNGGKAIPIDWLVGGEVCGLYNDKTIQHIIFYMGDEKYFESNTTGGIGDAKNIRADLTMSATVKSKLKVAIKYVGKTK